MRTSTTITETEKATYTAFCHQHRILNDESPEAIRNGEHIGSYIALWDVDITEDTLNVALEKLSDRLVFIPAEQVEVVEILSKLDQGQRDIVASWLSHQHRLETDGPKGFSNVSVLCAWLLNRRYAITEQGLTMALGNCQTNGRRKLYWKDGPSKIALTVQAESSITHLDRRTNWQSRLKYSRNSTRTDAVITLTNQHRTQQPNPRPRRMHGNKSGSCI
jgi:hypothetical protein